ncbi:hypothetical protein N7454_001539 [Penicillium verhagenii]|nr:hypothetical protein N7454_001539 [Penicillium verhagenii]
MPETDPYAASRLTALLDTSLAPYDEVVAFSEKIINENFEEILELYPDMKNIAYSESTVGFVDATLKATRILVPDEEAAKFSQQVYFQMCFESGTIRSPMGSLDVDVAGWELAVPCDLKTEAVQPMSSKIDGKKITSTTEVSGQVFHHPGDYSVERLYAQLSTIKFSMVIPKYSTIIDNVTQKRMTLEEWKNLESNHHLYEILSTVLTKWASTQERMGRTILNVSFSIPENRCE